VNGGSAAKTLHIKRGDKERYAQQSFENFKQADAYAVAFALAALAIIALLIMNIFRPKEP